MSQKENQLVAVAPDAFQHSILSINASPDLPMAMVTVYLDDSGTHQESDVAVAACFISDVRRWTALYDEWLPILEQAGIKDCGFHMADFVAHAEPYTDWPEGKRDSVFHRLVGLINKYAYQGVVSAVIKADYDRLITGKLREKLGHHHFTFAVQV
ncbi:MAG: hypothetical protein ACRD50_13550 [Candidatus Acidiferrales bacterium]